MSKKKPEKNNPYLEAVFKDVLVCKNSSLRPYIEIFTQAPENIANQNLGTIAGILEITDDSEDSSYIVNYIISVIKKEYCRKSKRGSIESFEAALNKANLALAKLAEHGSISWVGKINAAILVIEKNNIHLSLAGNARALLLRKGTLTDIGESSPKIEAPNPLKTFVDVVSGRLEKDDKFLITTEYIFDIFSLEELKRSALKFSTPEFIQFLKTALGNELERSAVLFIETLEKEKENEIIVSPEKDEPEITEEKKINAFSQAAFSKTIAKKKENGEEKSEAREIIKQEEKQTIINEAKDELAKKNGNFVDKKTGHIYIKEDSFLREEESKLESIKYNFSQYSQSFLSFSSKMIAARKERKEDLEKSLSEERPKSDASLEENSRKFFSSSRDKTKELFSKMNSDETKEKLKEKSEKILQLIKRHFSAASSLIFRSALIVFEKTKSLLKQIREKSAREEKNASAFSAEPSQKQRLEISKIPGKIKPDFSAIKNIFGKFDSRQKVLAAGALFFLLIVPYFLSKIDFEKKDAPAEAEKTTEEVSVPLVNDKNVKRVASLNQDEFEAEILKVINLNGKIFVLTPEKIISADDKTESVFPENFSTLKTASAMDDLNFLFLLDSKNKVLSWSPANKQFEENQFSTPEKADLDFAQTFLTYLLVFDKNEKQVYRYPRVTGGFGEKSNRLDEPLNSNETVDMAVGENIFLAEKNAIYKFFQGRKESFDLEKTATPISIDKIHTREESQNLYILDKENARILKLDLSGNILSQFHHPEISSATDFTVSDNTNTIHFSKGKVLQSFLMN
jgi:hypothetical protein